MTDISMIAQLREFGFTESEAKVYVALLEGGAVSGYEASKLSGVARSKIYTILEALIQRGAVLSSSDGRATLYRAESPAHLAVRRDGSGAAQPRTRRRGARLRPE